MSGTPSRSPAIPCAKLVASEPAVGDRARVTFSLPTSSASPELRWYPKQVTVVGYVNGVAATLASVDTAARTVTFAAAPGSSPGVSATHKAALRGRAGPR